MKKQLVRNVADIITKRFARRTLVQGGASLSLLAFLGGCKDEDVKTPGPALPDADSGQVDLSMAAVDTPWADAVDKHLKTSKNTVA